MSYSEKRTIASILGGILVLAAYCIYAFGKYQAGLLPADDLRAWAITMLIFIGAGIVAMIIIQIVFHVLLSIGIAIRDRNTNEAEIENSIKYEMVEDERDRLIELKSSKVGFAFAGFGFVLALLALVLHYSPMVMLNILFIAFAAGSMVEGITSIFYYRNGIRNA